MTLHKFKMLTKPFWVPLIALIYSILTQNPNMTVLIALLFGWIGDLLLMRGRKTWFVAGAVSFMIGHIVYILIFLQESGGFSVFAEHPLFCGLLILPYIIYAVFLKRILGKNISSVILSASLYIIILLLMSYASLLRVWNVSVLRFILTFLGSLLFIASDSLIAVRKFKRQFRGIGTFIVVTYITAQLLIIAGLA